MAPAGHAGDGLRRRQRRVPFQGRNRIDYDCLRQLLGEEEVVGGVLVHGYGHHIGQAALRMSSKKCLKSSFERPLPAQIGPEEQYNLFQSR